MIEILDLSPEQRPFYDKYVTQSATGLPQHLSGWRDVLIQTYGYETRFLTAVQDSQIIGAMPLFLIDSPLLGRAVRTMPGGLAAENEGAATALIDAAYEWAKETAAQRLIIADSRHSWNSPHLTQTSHHVYWSNDVQMSQAALWKQLDSNIRRQVRIARKNNLAVHFHRDLDAIGPFFRLFLQFAHKNGTPLYGQCFLENVVNAFPNQFNIAMVYQDKRPLGGYFQLEMGQSMYGLWGATLPQYLHLRPVYLAYWEILGKAIEQGFKTVDMGRSPLNSNASHFKGQWGGTSQPIFQLTTALSKNKTQQAQITPSVAKFRMVSRCWPYLPEPVAKYLGPKLRRHMPFA